MAACFHSPFFQPAI